MTKVFIGGSRRISRLSAEVKHRIDRIIERGFPVLIGDANGADKAVQRYLKEQGYKNVEIFCVGGHCRNNLGGWPVRSVPSRSTKKDFTFYASKDWDMCKEATVGFMIWDGKSTGTLFNALRIIEQRKSVLLYLAPAKTFTEVKEVEDWHKFLLDCPSSVRERLTEKMESEKKSVEGEKELSFFSGPTQWNPGTR